MIRNTLLAGVLVLGALIFGTPALVGLYLAHNFDHFAARINRAGVLRVIGTRFERGWFESQARITVQLADRFCARAPCATFTLDSTIHQGPLAFTAPAAASDHFAPAWLIIDSRLALAPLWPRLAFTPALAPLHGMTRVGLTGQVTSHSGLPAACFDIAGQATRAQAEMAPLAVTAHTQLDAGALQITVAWPLLRVDTNSSAGLDLEGLRVDLHSAAHDRGRIVEQHLRVNALAVDDGQGQTARLRQLVWRANASVDDADDPGLHFNGRVKQIDINGDDYGPLIMEGRIAGVDQDLWQALKQQLITAEHADAPDISTLRALYRLYLPPVLAVEPAFDVKFFSLVTPAGLVSGQLHIAAPDDLRPPQSLAGLLDQLSLSFHGRMPAPMLGRIIRHIAEQRELLEHAVSDADVAKALQRLASKGWIEPVQAGRAYQLRVAVEQGRIHLGGHAEPDWKALLQSVRDR